MIARCLTAAGLGWTLFTSVATAHPEAVARFALVVGHNDSDVRDRAGLRYGDDDAVAMHRLLSEAGVQSTLLVQPDEDTSVLHPELVHQAPSLSALSRAAARIARAVRSARTGGASTEFIFFYSGHGDVQGDEGYVTVSDGRVTRSQLYTLLETVGAARNHVLIDACRSYFLVFGRGPGGRRKRYEGPAPGPYLPAQLRNTGFVLSTGSDRESHEWERFRAGIFSHEVRSALRGGADADQNAVITYAELGAFVEKANASVPPRFRPDILVHPPADGVGSTLLDWPATTPTIELSPARWGHIYVENPSGERVMDVHPLPNRRLALHASSDRPLYVRRHDQSMEYVLQQAGEDRVVPEAGQVPSIAPRGALSLVFDGLFSAPMVASDVDRFARATYAENRRTFETRLSSNDDVTLERDRRMRSTSLIVGSAGLGLLAAGFGTWISARNKEHDLRQACGEDRRCSADADGWRETQADAQRNLTLSRTLMSIGGAALAVAVVVRYARRSERTGQTAARGELHCGPNNCTARASLQF